MGYYSEGKVETYTILHSRVRPDVGLKYISNNPRPYRVYANYDGFYMGITVCSQ